MAGGLEGGVVKWTGGSAFFVVLGAAYWYSVKNKWGLFVEYTIAVSNKVSCYFIFIPNILECYM